MIFQEKCSILRQNIFDTILSCKIVDIESMDVEMNLRAIREEQQLSQMEVAHILKVSRSVYGMWEAEHDLIPLKRLNDFCYYFEVSLDYALGLTEIKSYPQMKHIINKDKIKERLKNLRKENNLTQDKLSQKIKITRSLISKYENGTNTQGIRKYNWWI